RRLRLHGRRREVTCGGASGPNHARESGSFRRRRGAAKVRREEAAMADVKGVEVIRGFLGVSPLVRHLGMRIVTLERDRATLLLPFTESVVTVGDVVHGGAISALVDTTAMASAWSTPELPDTPRGTTVSLTVDFVS